MIVTGKSQEEGRFPQQSMNKLCPFIYKPFEGCYCTSTSSLYTESTIYYCGSNFAECEIYKRHMALRGANA